jgi:hypothetical protein
MRRGQHLYKIRCKIEGKTETLFVTYVNKVELPLATRGYEFDELISVSYMGSVNVEIKVEN